MRAIYITSDEERAGVEEYRSTKENDREYHRDKRKGVIGVVFLEKGMLLDLFSSLTTHPPSQPVPWSYISLLMTKTFTALALIYSLNHISNHLLPIVTWMSSSYLKIKRQNRIWCCLLNETYPSLPNFLKESLPCFSSQQVRHHLYILFPPPCIQFISKSVLPPKHFQNLAISLHLPVTISGQDRPLGQLLTSLPPLEPHPSFCYP